MKQIIRYDLVLKAILLILVFLKLFDLRTSFPLGWLDFPLLFLLFAVSWPKNFKKNVYSPIIFAYMALILVSCIYSTITKDQIFYQVFGHSYNYFGIIFFFYMYKCRISAREAEIILITYSIICCCCYILQWLIYPTILFSGADLEYWSDEVYRVRIPGSIGCYCLLLYSINKLVQKKKLIYIITTILGGLPIIIQGFRSLVTLSLIAIILLILFTLKNKLMTFIWYPLFALAILFIIQTDVVQYKLEEMQQRQESNHTFANKEYIRWIELDYYWNEQCPSIMDKLLGGGVSDNRNSQYAKKMGKAYERGIFWDDLGLIGLGLIIGFPTVILLVIMYLLCIWRCKESELQYIRFALSIVLFGSLFTTAELFRSGNILLFSLILYLEYAYHKEKKYVTI